MTGDSLGSPLLAAFDHAHAADLRSRPDIELFRDDMERWMADHDVVFADARIPFALAPHSLDEPTLDRVRHAVEVITRVLDRCCTAYRTDPVLRDALDLPPAEDDLIRIEPTLDSPLKLCRLDGFLLADGRLQFLEFNAESPAGIGYTDVMYDGLHEHFAALHDPPDNINVTYERILPHLVATMRDVESRWRAWTTAPDGPGRAYDIPGHVERPRATLVDVSNTPSLPEFGIICRALSAAGFDADYASLDELTFHTGRLHAHGRPVDVVYRRALVEDILDPHASPGAAALLAAVRAGTVAMLNPFPARVANNKKLLALIGAPAFDHLLDSDEERRVVRETMPWTRVLATGSTTLPDGSTGDLPSHVTEHRTRYVLKPASDYGGHNVYLGARTDAHMWAALVHAHAGTSDWIVQEYLDVPIGRFPAIEHGQLVTRERYFNINPFAIGGHYAGMITRISAEPVINVSAGGGLLPCVCVRPRAW